ncbi:hypothetical protein NVS89_22450 [Ancylobacter sp. MQZ15Z-1]|uniref:Uncharacterized protein n=1 Tax=Ancylobacter mangrovi TaxID=2972472 RepID=A0A9X2T3Y6_9HYPH|nr:hypothetical protein [Ancylobacter mangrovi]MCS0497855.1 hypothetical protein [Ancylobacter mangrovi]
MTATWPSSLKPSQITDPELVASYATGGRTSNGLEQRVLSDAGYWRLSYTFAIRSREQVLAWRALVTRMKAGEAVVATVYDMHRATGADAAGSSATVLSPVPIGSVSALVAIYGIEAEPGAMFSIGDRLYRVVAVTAPGEAQDNWLDADAWTGGEPWPAPTLGVTPVQLWFLPPLRAAAPAGTRLSFQNLRLQCWPEGLSSIPLDLDLGKFADPTLTLVEAL